MTNQATSEIIQGDNREMLAPLPEKSVHCCITSPPYLGLRDYGDTGHLGLEDTLDKFIANQIDVFRVVWRVLRDDGVLWLNMGDKMENKNLLGLPWRLAFALQADGWYLRSAMPWVKRSAMPESATDRPASSLEYMFMFTKKARYYFDMEAVRRQAASATRSRERYSRILKNDGPQSVRHDHETNTPENGRNWRNSDLWFESIKPQHGLVGIGDELVGLDVTSQGLSLKHFASFPERLVSPCIKAGTSDKGACPECGAPWRRVVNVSGGTIGKDWGGDLPTDTALTIGSQRGGSARAMKMKDGTYERTTIGWEPGCECYERYATSGLTRGRPEDKSEWLVDSCTVLDPYLGSGTSGIVAKQLGRSFIGIEINPEYCEMARQRIANPRPEPELIDVQGQETLF